MMAKNYYDILGVSRSATRAEIRSVYKEVARVYHPDSRFYDEIVEEDISGDQMKKFQEITAAYNTLMNEQARAKYDQTILGDLKDWDGTQDEHESDEDMFSIKRGKNPYVWGTFGKSAPPQSSFFAQGPGDIRSVSEIIASRRGFFARLRRIFGF